MTPDAGGSNPITTTYVNDNQALSQVLVAGDGISQTTNLFGLDLISQDKAQKPAPCWPMAWVACAK